jgi:UPF0755 protein
MRRLLKSVLLLASAAGVALIGWTAWFATQPLRLRESPLEFSIERGSTLRTVSLQLAQSGVRMLPTQFTILGRVMGKATNIKAGNYAIQSGLTPLQLLDKFTAGDISQAEVTFIEGWTFRQLRAALDAHPALRHDSTALGEIEILSRIGATEIAAEGLFFPDTYLFPKNSSDLDLMRRAYHAMQGHLEAEWEGRDRKVPYATSYEALVLASLVEKETGIASDRPIIASVFVNRLRAGMPLQTDPSVIYGMGAGFDGNLRKRDLQRDTVFNTYTRGGLPPTPIALPGLASIQAALRPAPTGYLYFVARGDGTSEFSVSLEEHNRAVNKYQKRKVN